MLPPNKINHPSNLALNLMELGQAFNTQTALTTNRLTAILMVLDKEFPGFRDKYEKQMFAIQIANIAGSIEKARRDGGKMALTIISDNGNALKKLKKEAKAKDKKYLEAGELDIMKGSPTWLTAYREGMKDAKKFGERLDKEALKVGEDES